MLKTRILQHTLKINSQNQSWNVSFFFPVAFYVSLSSIEGNGKSKEAKTLKYSEE